jgi:polyhydroxyalkanoate synthesis repressor PhaR
MLTMTPDPIQIRRYPNRRFYDRSRRCYVTFADIEELVLQGRTIEVRDSRTDEDLTPQILTHILLTRHPEKIDLLPVALLQGMLRANDLAAEFWRAYLRYAVLAMEGWQKSISPANLSMPWLSALLPGWPAAMPAAEATEAMASRLAALEERIARLEGEAAAAPAAARNSGGAGVFDRIEERVRGLEERSSAKSPPRYAGDRGPADPKTSAN